MKIIGEDYLNGSIIKYPTIDKLQQANLLLEKIIENLDNAAINQMMNGSGKDLDGLLEVIFLECYEVLFGNTEDSIKDSNYKYLDKLQENIEETLRCENINYFLLSVFPEFETEWYHLEWGQFVMKWNRLCIQASRGGGKSYYFSNIVPLWKMYRYKNKYDLNTRRDLRLCEKGNIVTAEQSLGIELMEIIKTNIEENPILNKKLMPEKKEKWADKSIRTKNGARLSARTYGGTFRGKHPHYLIVDDLLKENQLYSDTQRKKATDYFHAVLMNALVAVGQAIVVGTPFHENDLYGDLQSKANFKDKGKWKVLKYPGIFPNGKLLSPYRLPFHELMNKKETQGNIIFSREILLRPITSDSSIFPFDILKKSFVGMEKYTLVKNRESFPIKFNKVVTGCDYARSANVGADYTVFTTWGITDSKVRYLINILRKKGMKFGEQIAAMKMIYSNFRPDVMVVENNAFQEIFAEEGRNANLPIISHTTGKNKYDLQHGLPGLAIDFEMEKIKFPRGDEYSRNMTDIIVGEFNSIAFVDKGGLKSVGQNDDTAMSSWFGKIGAEYATTKTLSTGIGFLD